MTQEASFDSLRSRYNATVGKEQLADFVRQAAGRPEFTAWLNSGHIYCKEFFACITTARRLSVPIPLTATRQTALDWFDAATRIVSSSGRTSMASLIARVDAATPKPSDEVRRFILEQTHLPGLFGAHEFMFLAVFSEAVKNGQDEIVLRRLRENPPLMSDYEILSAMAQRTGPEIIRVYAMAQAQHPDPDLLNALRMLTGRGSETPTETLVWYRTAKLRLQLNAHGLYPAPFGEPMFVMSEHP